MKKVELYYFYVWTKTTINNSIYAGKWEIGSEIGQR